MQRSDGDQVAVDDPAVHARLAAYALGLGTFWITPMGGAERVREAVGLPYDPITDTAELKVCAVRIEPASGVLA